MTGLDQFILPRQDAENILRYSLGAVAALAPIIIVLVIFVTADRDQSGYRVLFSYLP